MQCLLTGVSIFPNHIIHILILSLETWHIGGKHEPRWSFSWSPHLPSAEQSCSGRLRPQWPGAGSASQRFPALPGARTSRPLGRWWSAWAETPRFPSCLSPKGPSLPKCPRPWFNYEQIWLLHSAVLLRQVSQRLSHETLSWRPVTDVSRNIFIHNP